MDLTWGVSVEVRPYFLNRDQDGSSEKRLLFQYLNIYNTATIEADNTWKLSVFPDHKQYLKLGI